MQNSGYFDEKSKIHEQWNDKLCKNLLPTGSANYSACMKERIFAQKVSWGAIMPQTKLPLMGYSSKPTKQKSETATLK